jgi:hypothetical protein
MLLMPRLVARVLARSEMRQERGKHSLAVLLRLGGRSVILVGEGPVADAQRRLLERTGARIVAEGAKAALAIVIDDPGAVSRLKVRGALVYAVDRSDLSDFTLSETVGRGSEPIADVRPAIGGFFKRAPLKELVPQAAAIQEATAQTADAQKMAALKATAHEEAVRDVAARKAAALETATREVAAQKAIAQDEAAQDVAAQKALALEAATREVAAQKAIAQDEAAQDVAAQKALALEAATRELSDENTTELQ